MLLNEVFDNPTKWDVKDSGPKRASFEFIIDDNVYVVEINRSIVSLQEIQVYDVNFAIKINGSEATFDLTNTGNQYTVFSTVMDIIKDFTSKNEVGALFFNAKEQSRISLYTKMISLFKRIGFPANTIKKNWKNLHYFIVATDDNTLELIVDRLSMLRHLE